MFGYPADAESPELYWGARAIFNDSCWEGYGKKTKYVPPSIDLVHDRQSFVGHDHPEKERFMKWLNGEALPALRKWAESENLNSRNVFTFGDGAFVLKASPNASYGYLYIGAWFKPQKEEIPQ